MHPNDGTKEAWEELHWDQDVGRWIGPRRDEPHHRPPRPDPLD
jgi:hypothetical protein